MNFIRDFLERYQSRNLLIGIAAILLILTLVDRVNDAYEDRQGELAGKLAKLKQYQQVTMKAEGFNRELQSLRRVKAQTDRYFFSGENDDKLASAMQLRIQALVAKADMQAESIRPLLQRNEGKQDKDGEINRLGEVVIKIRLAGSLQQFMNFMVDLYNGNEFFAINSISLKPDSKSGLKVFVELKGYYILPGVAGNFKDMGN